MDVISDPKMVIGAKNGSSWKNRQPNTFLSFLCNLSLTSPYLSLFTPLVQQFLEFGRHWHLLTDGTSENVCQLHF